MDISKQAVHQRLNLHYRREREGQLLIPSIEKIRQDHPRISSRKIYRMIQPSGIGRDRFEAFCFKKGFKVKLKRNPQRTTNSLGVTRFENHLHAKELTGVNQAWVSDITYYRIANKFYYLTFIMDQYSRRIVGYSASKTLCTCDTTVPALKMAKRSRKGAELNGLILHSDGGGQYYSKELRKLTKKYTHSMAGSVYENPHAERINGIIKNEYLIEYKPETFEQLEKMLAKAVVMYNIQRPHQSIKYMTPNAFENTKQMLSTNNQVVNKVAKL